MMHIGDIVVSVNPFDWCTWVINEYGSDLPPALLRARRPHLQSDGARPDVAVDPDLGRVRRRQDGGDEDLPHLHLAVRAVGTRAATRMREGPGADEVAARLMMTNPVMEAIGNAKTIRNNNSSRFGKHFDIQFRTRARSSAPSPRLPAREAAHLRAHEGERNYHIFYMLCKAPDRSIARAGASPSGRTTTSARKRGRRRGDDVERRAEFGHARGASSRLGFNQSSSAAELYTMLSACLNAGNVKFRGQESGSGA